MSFVSPVDRFVMTAAPARIGRVRLRVRDLPLVSDFYHSVIGLHRLAADPNWVLLGTATTPLLELSGDPTLAPRERRAAGLFHTAFLLPDRTDLGRWLTHAAAHRVGLDGASDHLVSEAVYLTDPEGNGIEIYADRSPAGWRGADGAIRMASDPLNLSALRAAAGDTVWQGFPEGGLVGHVHLQVGDTALAETFYAGLLGFDVTARYPGASFFGSGAYHHQLAGNIWHSRGAGRRRDDSVGLAGFDLVIAAPDLADALLDRADRAGTPAIEDDQGLTLRDPWGTAIRLVR